MSVPHKGPCIWDLISRTPLLEDTMGCWTMSWFLFQLPWGKQLSEGRVDFTHSSMLYSSTVRKFQQQETKRISHVESPVKRREWYMCAHLWLNFLSPLVYNVKSPAQGMCYPQWTGLLTSVMMVSITFHRYPHKPTRSQQPITETLFPGNLRLCQVDKVSHCRWWGLMVDS